MVRQISSNIFKVNKTLVNVYRNMDDIIITTPVLPSNDLEALKKHLHKKNMIV